MLLTDAPIPDYRIAVSKGIVHNPFQVIKENIVKIAVVASVVRHFQDTPAVEGRIRIGGEL